RQSRNQRGMRTTAETRESAEISAELMPRRRRGGMGWETRPRTLRRMRGGKRVRAALGLTRQSLIPQHSDEESMSCGAGYGREDQSWRGWSAEQAESTEETFCQCRQEPVRSATVRER